MSMHGGVIMTVKVGMDLNENIVFPFVYTAL